LSSPIENSSKSPWRSRESPQRLPNIATILIHLKSYAGAQMMDQTYGASLSIKNSRPTNSPNYAPESKVDRLYERYGVATGTGEAGPAATPEPDFP
jgi:hypothetical protein